MSGAGDVRADITRWRSTTREHSAVPEPVGDGRRRSRRILIAPSFTAHPIDPGLGLGLLDRSGEVASIAHHDYNQIFQLCLDADASAVDGLDDLVVLWRIEDVFERDFLEWADGDDAAFDRLVAGAASLGQAIASCRSRIDASLIVSDAPVPIGFGLDHDDPAELTSLVAMQTRVNEAFDRGLGDAAVDRLRLAALQHAAGTVASFDRRNWLMYRQPFTTEFAHVVGQAIADVIRGRTTPGPKVLVLDCDNTIWGGIAVDDGIGALQAGDAFPGFAYRSFQIAAAPSRQAGRAARVGQQERSGDRRAGIRRGRRDGPDR